MNRPVEEYLKQADDLAQDVINAWGSNWYAGTHSFTPEFNALLEKTVRYCTAKNAADTHREFNVCSERTAAEERESRLAFAQAYKTFWEPHEAELEKVIEGYHSLTA